MVGTQNRVSQTTQRGNGKRASGIHGKTQVAKYSINTLREKMPEDPVKYKSEKNIHYFTIGNTTVIAWKHPTDEKTGLGASASVEGVSAGYA